MSITYVISWLSGHLMRKKKWFGHREWNIFKTLTNEVLPQSPFIWHGSYSWIRSPKTNAPLQLDLFFPKLIDAPFNEFGTQLAIEIQGEQHLSWDKAKFFFKKRADWDYYIQCDAIKEAACLANRIPLIKIMPNDPVDRDTLTLLLWKVLSSYAAG